MCNRRPNLPKLSDKTAPTYVAKVYYDKETAVRWRPQRVMENIYFRTMRDPMKFLEDYYFPTFLPQATNFYIKNLACRRRGMKLARLPKGTIYRAMPHGQRMSKGSARGASVTAKSAQQMIPAKPKADLKPRQPLAALRPKSQKDAMVYNFLTEPDFACGTFNTDIAHKMYASFASTSESASLAAYMVGLVNDCSNFICESAKFFDTAKKGQRGLRDDIKETFAELGGMLNTYLKEALRG